MVGILSNEYIVFLEKNEVAANVALEWCQSQAQTKKGLSN